MKIVVIDGQGGSLGRALCDAVCRALPGAEVLCVGTNAVATSNMMNAPVSAGASGENAVVYNVQTADYVVGPVGIVFANAMYGEVTPKMAEAVSSCSAKKILVPMTKCNATVVGVEPKSVSKYIEDVVACLL